MGVSLPWRPVYDQHSRPIGPPIQLGFPRTVPVTFSQNCIYADKIARPMLLAMAPRTPPLVLAALLVVYLV